LTEQQHQAECEIGHAGRDRHAAYQCGAGPPLVAAPFVRPAGQPSKPTCRDDPDKSKCTKQAKVVKYTSAHATVLRLAGASVSACVSVTGYQAERGLHPFQCLRGAEAVAFQ